MSNDPFDDDFDPAAEEVIAPEPETDGEEPAQPTTPVGVSLTFKGDGGYYAPWIVLRGPDVPTVTEMVNEELQELMKLSTRYAAAHFKLAQSIKGEGGGSSGGSSGGRAPQEAQEHPRGKKEFCEHGRMKYVTGLVKRGKNAGKTFHAFDCPEGICDRKWDNG